MNKESTFFIWSRKNEIAHKNQIVNVIKSQSQKQITFNIMILILQYFFFNNLDIFCSILGYLYMNPIEISRFLGWFMSCNTTFNIISVILYCGGQFYCWRKPEYPEKITNLSQVTDKLCHIMLYRLNGIRTHNISGDNTLDA